MIIGVVVKFIQICAVPVAIGVEELIIASGLVVAAMSNAEDNIESIQSLSDEDSKEEIPGDNSSKEAPKGKLRGGNREKTKGANKKDKKQVNDAGREKNVNDRKGFGKFIEKEKKLSGRGGSDNFTYEELLDLADEFNNGG